MRFFIALLVAGVTAVAFIAFAAPTNHGLIVHEWGTFTSVQGSDGTLMEGLQREEEYLPQFVHHLSPFVHDQGKGLTYPAIHVTQKMETPVLYFYTKESQHVRVTVEFKNGLLSQWYPRATSVDPSKEQHPFDLTQIKHSSLQWDVDLIPLDEEKKSGPPSLEEPIQAGSPWKFTREVASASVNVGPGSNSEAGEHERFLFYRGLGNFTLPITIRANKGNEATVQNTGKDELPAAFAMEITPDGARYVEVGKVAAGATVGFSLGKVELNETKRIVEDLKAKVQTALVAQGLFNDEAKAMVNTWSRQWFTSAGTRLIYLVSRETTDGLLPLQITPAPEKLVRVLVGRLEYITPETELQVIQALGHPDDYHSQANNRLYQSGRFMEPYVLRVMALSHDPAVQQGGRRILEQLKPAS